MGRLAGTLKRQEILRSFSTWGKNSRGIFAGKSSVRQRLTLKTDTRSVQSGSDFRLEFVKG